ERGDHEGGVDGEEAVLAEGRGAVPDRVHAHREQQAGERDEDAPQPPALRRERGEAEADAGQHGEERVRERRHDDAYEERRGGHRGDAAFAGELVGAEGGAQIEDVLGEREAGGGDPGYDHAVDDPGEVPSAEQEDQQDGGRLRRLLDDGRYHGRAEGVRAG